MQMQRDNFHYNLETMHYTIFCTNHWQFFLNITMVKLCNTPSGSILLLLLTQIVILSGMTFVVLGAGEWLWDSDSQRGRGTVGNWEQPGSHLVCVRVHLFSCRSESAVGRWMIDLIFWNEWKRCPLFLSIIDNRRLENHVANRLVWVPCHNWSPTALLTTSTYSILSFTHC